MKLIQPYALLILCGLFLFACEPTTSTEETSTTDTDESAIVEVELEDEPEDVQFVSIADIKDSETSKKLAELVYYENNDDVEEEKDEEDEYHPEMLKQVYPIGWSKDGAWAYAEIQDTYHGGTEFVFSIKNMATGGDLLEQETRTFIFVDDTTGMDIDDYGEVDPNVVLIGKDNYSGAELFKYMWLYSEERALTLAKKHNIIVNPTGEYLKGAKYKGLTFSIKKEQIGVELDSIQFVMNTNKNTPVAFYSDYNFGRELSIPSISGIVKNPHGNAFVVVANHEQQFFEMTMERLPLFAGFDGK